MVESITRAQGAVDIILRTIQNMPELKPVFEVCKNIWETLKQQGDYDALATELVSKMGDALQHIAAVEDYTKTAKLRETINELSLLSEDASRFVVEYKSDGTTVRAARAFVSSNAQEKVNEFVDKFEELKESFDRGIAIQVAQRVEKLLNDADRALLEKLIVPGADYNLGRTCLEGTRVEILEDICNWAFAPTGTSSLFWLYGPAGCGKSSVATSVSELLYKSRALAGSFFCRRDNEQLRKPENVISQLAASLGYECPAYGENLVEVLRRDPKLSHAATKSRFVGLVISPLESIDHTTSSGTLVIVVDAIDECGTSESRVELLRCLVELSQLASWLKVLITSRPNDEIRQVLESQKERVESRNLFAEAKASVTRDIKAYIQSCIKDISIEATDRDRWPDDQDVRRLSESSNGLFIWARTACKLIQQSLDPGATLDLILNGQRSRDEKKALGGIYTTALNECLGETNNSAGIIQLCIGAIVLTGSRRPLPDAALAAMLSRRVKPHVLSRVVNRLGSVLYRDDQSAVRVLHQSFSDYMAEADCPEHYRIDLAELNAELVASCLEVMLRDLKFNICDLEDSRIMNRDVVDLQARIEANISPELMYSCTYWTTHLVVSSFQTMSENIGLLNELLDGPYVLYWIEVLSLVNEIHVVTEGMARMVNWSEAHNPQYAKIATDIYRFTFAASEAISISTPHLYVSALPFGAANYATLRSLKSHFPNTLSIITGLNLWNFPCLRVLHAHGAINSISVSPDGRRIVFGSRDMTLQVCGLQTGTALDPLQGHLHAVTSVAFSPDGQRIVSGSADTTIRIWDAHTGNILLGPLHGHYDRITSVTFSPDGRRVISGSEDRTVRIWDSRTGMSLLKPLRGHSKTVLSLAYSPNGLCIVSGSRDMTIRIWDAQSGAEHLSQLRGHSHKVTSITFASDSRRIASGSGDKTVRIWDMHTGAPILGPLRGHSDTVTSVAFSSDCQRIASGSHDMTVRIWDAETGASLLGPLRGHSNIVTSVGFSPDGRSVFSGSHDKTACIWDTQNSLAYSNTLEGHSHSVKCLAISPDDQRIACGYADCTLRIWDAKKGTALSEPLCGHQGAISSVAFSSDGRRIVSGSQDKTVWIWDVQTGAALFGPLEGHPNRINSVVFSSDGQHVLSFSKGRWASETLLRRSSDSECRALWIWDTQTGTALPEPSDNSLSRAASKATCVAFSPDGRRAVSAAGGVGQFVPVWDVQTGSELISLALRTSGQLPNYVSFSPDGCRVVACSTDNQIMIWDAKTGTQRFSHGLDDKCPSGTEKTISFSPDGRFFISGQWGFIVVCDLRPGDGSRLRVLEYPESTRAPCSQLPQVIESPHLIYPFKFRSLLGGYPRKINSVAFFSDSRRIASGSIDGTVRIWDLECPPTSADMQAPLHKSVRVPSGELANQLQGNWVCKPSGERVFWLPPAYQRQDVDHSLSAIPVRLEDHPVALDLSKLKFGTNWAGVIDKP
ncbi:hypothetical protein FRC09_001488, partial [Ceratobasidium sp. 395]